MRVLIDSVKFICIFLLIGPAITSYSQNNCKHLVDGVLYIDSLTDNGILLDTGWKMQTGDNFQWATPDFNDEKWTSYNPTTDVSRYVERIGHSICWLRLKIHLNNTLNEIPFVLRIQQNAASEIYIDGKLEIKYGIVSDRSELLKTYNPLNQPLSFVLSNKDIHTIAVRIIPVQHLSLDVYAELKNQFFSAYLCDANIVTKNVYQSFNGHGQTSLRIGVFIILMVLHLGFFCFYPSQKANLFFGIFSLLMATGHYLHYLLLFKIHDVELNNLVKFINIMVLSIWYWFLLEAVYSLLKRKRRFFYWSFVVIILTLFIINFAEVWNVESASNWLLFYFPILVNLEALRLSISAFNKKIRNAKIIIIGASGFVVFSFLAVYFLSQYESYESIGEYSSLALDLSVNASILFLPLSVSIFLVFEFGFTHRQLLKEQAAKVRIAQDLHDDLGSQLSAAHIFLNAYRNNSNGCNKEQLLTNSINLLESSIKDLRHIMNDIQHSTLLDKGYIAATKELVNKINYLQDINFSLSHHDVKGRFDYKIENNLFRVTQELINNTLKYAKAKNISIELIVRDNDIIFMYEDDGEGCIIETITRGNGLNNIKTRMEGINGMVDFDTIPGNGFRCTIEIPVIYV